MSTVEEYLADPATAADRASNAHFVTGAKLFNKEPLAPYSNGVYMLWLNLTNDGDHPRFMGALLVYVLISLQRCFNETSKEAAEEDRWRDATSTLLAMTDRKHSFRVRFMQWLAGLSKKQIERAVKISADLLEQADKESVDDEPEDEIKPPNDAITLSPGK